MPDPNSYTRVQFVASDLEPELELRKRDDLSIHLVAKRDLARYYESCRAPILCTAEVRAVADALGDRPATDLLSGEIKTGNPTVDRAVNTFSLADLYVLIDQIERLRAREA